MPVRIPLLSRRITVSSIADAVRSIDGSRRPDLATAVYQAAAKSPLLAAAIALSYPFTYCPHEDCQLSIAHLGEHSPVVGSSEPTT